MGYEAYCKAWDVHLTSPLSNDDFYQSLDKIAIRRSAVLAEIERMPIKNLSKLDGIISRGMDLLLCSVGLLVLAIPFLITSIVIKLSSPGPIFYRQARVGKGGRVFQIIKFRTMYNDAERGTGPIWAVTNDSRRTTVGAFLKQTRLDELPNLFNILKGEMAFVGPRPERPEFVYQFVQYIPAFNRRHEVTPGLTGLAQLRNGYDDSALSVYKKLRWDANYMKRKCLRLDLQILYHTGIAVLQGKV